MQDISLGVALGSSTQIAMFVVSFFTSRDIHISHMHPLFSHLIAIKPSYSTLPPQKIISSIRVILQLDWTNNILLSLVNIQPFKWNWSDANARGIWSKLCFANDLYLVYEFFTISQMYAFIGGEYDHHLPKSSMILTFSKCGLFSNHLQMKFRFLYQ